MKKVATYMLGCLFLLGTYTIFGQVKLPSIFTDNMVIQRNKPIHIWGWGRPNEIVEVMFDGEVKEVTVEGNHSWSIWLRSRKADTTPHVLYVRHQGQEIRLKNILIGDIWLCSGQSNMEWPLDKEMHYPSEVSKTDQGLLRLYNPTYAGENIYNKAFGDSIVKRLNREEFYLGHWESSNQTTSSSMSAVGYYFGKKILEETSVPIGLIHLAIGGAPIETFISAETLYASRDYRGKVTKNWLYNDALPKWIRERGVQNLGRAKDVLVDSLGPNHAYKPGFAYRAGVHPLLKMPIKGIIWYQGESNAQEQPRVDEYAELQAMMVRDYRVKWGDLQMPFYWAQLSAIDTKNYNAHLWPQFRDEQRKLLYMVPYGGMAVTSDIGAKNDVHPTNKKAVGDRLARWALHKTYGHAIVPSGPLVKKVKFKGDHLMVSFEHSSGLTTSDGMALRGFSLDGRREVKAYIQKRRVIIPITEQPEYLYYGWKAWTRGNLVNSEELPASTFKTSVSYDR
ncbi:sialate O-acetylesterase [Flagellimonas abyssi]|nr:sialate O-acetylesterase [Allomuricauda abyssi]